jgi:metal-responsive CopG/Arc/MetJ family transcriptional regulator
MAKVETSRMVMNIPVDLLSQLDEYASKMNINRTSAVCVLLSQSLSSQKAMTDLGELLRVYQEEQKKQTIEE